MDSFELNKIMGAVFGTCLIVLSLNIAAGALFSPEMPAKPGYEIAVPEAATSAPAAPEPSVPIAQLLAKADPKRGEASAKVCLTCHSFEKGAANKVGPNLYGVVGGPKAHLENFNYSSAMRGAGGEWNFEQLSEFLKSPRTAVPGTSMGFAGVSRDSARADIIAYMNSMSDKPVPLPKTAEAPAAEAPVGDAPAKEAPAAGAPAAKPEATPPAATPPAGDKPAASPPAK